MLSNWAIKQLQRITLDYMKLECSEGTCYGIIAVSSNKHPYLAVKSIHVLDIIGSSSMLCIGSFPCFIRLFTTWRKR